MITASRQVMIVKVLLPGARKAEPGDAIQEGDLRRNFSNAGNQKLLIASGVKKPPMTSNINNEKIIARAPC